MKTSKRLLALLLCLALGLSCLTGAAWAREPETSGRTSAPKGFQSLEFRQANSYQYGAEEPVRVLVLLSGQAAAEAPSETRASVRLRLARQHSALRTQLAGASVDYTENFEYGTLLNGLAITAAYGDLEKIAALPEVESVHICNHYAAPDFPQMDSANEMIGAWSLQNRGIRGSGQVIAVLDTGITPTHEAFGAYPGMLEQAALTQDQAEAFIARQGYGASLSAKIPFAYDYYDQDNDALDDLSGHGTHVSGIAAGYAQAEDGAVRFAGTAPDAQILAMKVFSSKAQGGTDSSVYFKALEDAYLLGADVINMSLGAQNGFTYDAELENQVFGNIYKLLREQGVAVVVAAGNEGSMADGSSNWAGPGYVTADYADYGVVGSPSTYSGNLSVASAENARYPMHVLHAGDQDIFLYDSEEIFWFSLRDLERLEYAVVPGYGAAEDYRGLAVEGRVALVSRGELSFQEKLDNAAKAGAIGLLVYNNEPGSIYMAIDDYSIPAAAISREDGEFLISRTEPEESEIPAPSGSDTEEDLNVIFHRVMPGEELSPSRYLIVNEDNGRAFDAAKTNVNSKNNALAVESNRGTILASAELVKATLLLENGTALSNGVGKYLSAPGSGAGIVLEESPEDLELLIEEDGSVTIQDKGCSLRYNSDWPGFRFFPAESSVMERADSLVQLYRMDPLVLAPTQVGSFTIPKEMVVVENDRAGRMSEFSSVGVTPDLELKPQISGVGGMVCSAAYGTTDGYIVYSGTSMATPNLSGAMVCLLQELKTRFPEQSRQQRMELAEALLESSARLLTQEDGSPYSPRKQGTGLVDLEAAAAAKAVILDPVLSLGASERGSFTLSFTLQSLSAEPVSYQLSARTLRDLVETMDLDQDGQADGLYNSLRSQTLEKEAFSFHTQLPEDLVTLEPGAAVQVEAELELSDEALETLLAELPNGGFLDGFAELRQVELSSIPASERTDYDPIFTDVPASQAKRYYYKPVYWAYYHSPVQITKGTTETEFGPMAKCTRGQVVTFLWRAVGCPAPSITQHPFTDVKKNSYYYKAMLWALEKGVTTGTSKTTFSPEATCTRSQVVTFLWRSQGCPAPSSTQHPFTDVKSKSFYYKAMLWAVENGVTKGTTKTTFSPGEDCNRGQVVTFLFNLLAKQERYTAWMEPKGAVRLHAAFTGFVGDWTAAPILEQHDWREIVDLEHRLQTTQADEAGNSYADYGYTYLDAAEFEINTDVNRAYAVNSRSLAAGNLQGGWAGDNPYAYTDYDDARVAISPYGFTDMIYAAPMQLRNARHLIMTATDRESGALYYVDDTPYLAKAAWDSEHQFWQNSGAFYYDGTDAQGRPLPGGTQVELRFYANLAWGEDQLGAIPYEELLTRGEDFLVWSFGLTVDDSVPLLEDLDYDSATGTLRITASDDQYLAAVQLYRNDQDTDQDLVYMEDFADDQPGQRHSLVIQGLEPGSYTLYAADYATNESSLLLGLGSGRLYPVHFICPEEADLGSCQGCWASRYAQLVLPTPEGNVFNFVGWFPEPLDRAWTREQLEEAALWEELRSPGEAVTIYGESWYYALLESPSDWADPTEQLQEYRGPQADYSGTWAFAGGDWLDQDWHFLDENGLTASVSVRFDEDLDLTLVDNPNPALLFDVESDGQGSYWICNAQGRYMTIQEGALAFAAEPDGMAHWVLDWDPETEMTLVCNTATGELLVQTVLNGEASFQLVPLDALDSQQYRLSGFGPRVLEYQYITAE
ncbi:MAG: S8 family serine peptidase [Oscillospiraceae bacterium]|nr:S8 family serine peptidase [Oscillospiraceae bacterium]